MKTTDRENSRKRRNGSNSNGSNGDDFQLSNKRGHAIDDDDSRDFLHDSDFLALKLSYGNDKPQIPTVLPQSPPYPLLCPPADEFLPQSLQSETLTVSPNLFGTPPVDIGTGTPLPPLPLPSARAAAAANSYMTDQFSNSNTSSIQRREVSSTPRAQRPPRARRNHNQTPREENKTFPPPFPWASNKRATVHSLAELTARKIENITGLVQCRRCEKQYEIGYNLMEKFNEVGTFIAENKESMHDRAPSIWMSPILPTCKFCEQENSVKPVISEKKKSINWLFLLLGQMLGCCTLDQLKYFCKHTDNHRTGAKDRVLYLTYLGLCKQLAPHGPFDR